jgi:hypothetical protein
MTQLSYRVRSGVLVSLARGTPRFGLALALSVLSAAGCTEEEPGAPLNGPFTGVDSSVTTPTVDSGLPVSQGNDAGAPVVAVDTGVSAVVTPDASASVGGSVDTPWCKAKTVLEKRCTTCHDGKGSFGSPDKISFANIDHLQMVGTAGAKYAQRIGVRIRATDKPMPPARNATEDELKTLEAWIAAGATGGANPTCTPPAGSDAGTPTVDAGSDAGMYGEWPADCEKRYKVTAHAPNATTPFMVPAGQEIHPQVIFDAPWGNEDVQAIAMKPIIDNTKVLHHWIMYEQGGGAFLTGWAPGAEEAAPLPADVGMYIAKGPQSLRLDMHYFNLNGTTEQADASGVEICVVTKAKFRKNTASVFPSFGAFGDLLTGMVPANAVNHPTTGVCNVSTTQPVTLLTASPHAHTLARSMKFTATVGGKDIVMHDGAFVFEEQRSYALPQPIVLNTGDKITTTCVYTNPNNRNISFGENTGNEMCFNFAVYYPVGALSCKLF